MGTMRGDEEDYDWVDDENLDLDETMRRFEQLEAAAVVTTPYGFSTARTTGVTGVIPGHPTDRLRRAI